MNLREIEMLLESNAIERVYDARSLLFAAKAWIYGKTILSTLRLNDVLMMHHTLMYELRPDIAGRLRTCAVRVGDHYCPMELPFAIEQKLRNWIEQCYKNEEMTEKEAHIRFEKLHPFEDGNGRIGRILYNLQRLNKGKKIRVIHEGKEQMKYYEWFK